MAYFFLRSAIPKLNYPLIFADAVEAYRVLPPVVVPSVVVFVPWLEVVVALSLVSGLLIRGATILAGLLATGFALLVTSALWRGLDISCGCFTTDISRIHWNHVVFDLVLLALSILTYTKGPGWLALDSRYRVENSASD